MLTYGADLFRDRSRNTDSSITTVTGFGPPQTEVSTVPSVPNAIYQSAGAFLQGDVEIVPGASLILGGRYQDVRAATRATPGRDEPPIRAGATVIRRGGFAQRVHVAMTNLTDALYAEFSNASFFRPEPRRGVTLGWEMTF
jgi:outer membrane receptor protein involved in Fe transport